MPPRHYSKRPYGIAYHGYYCGPGWSAGEYRTSVSGGPEPTDALDRLCQKHDSQYASGYDRKRADAQFYKAAMKLGYPKAQIAGILVGAQGYFRKEGVQHWSKRRRVSPPESNKGKEIMKTLPTEKKEINSEMSLQKYKSFRKKSMGIGGFIGGYTKTKKFHKKVTDKYFSNIIEAQGTISDANCVYIGHSTMPPDRALRNVAYAMFRALWANRGFYIQDFQGVLPGNYRIIAQYRESPTGVVTDATVSDGVGTKSLDNHVNDFVVWYLNQVSTLGNKQIIVDTLVYTPYTAAGISTGNEISADVSIYNLHASSIHLISINNFKVQNRTKHLAGTTDEEETTTANDTAPLVGMIYGGKSNGMWVKTNRGNNLTSLVAADSTGIIGYCPTTAGTLHSDLWEPPAPSYFANCHKVGSIKLEPGEIKTSKLVSKYRSNISRFLMELAPVFNASYNVAFRQGTYNILAMEKLLGIKSSAVVQPKVEVAYELNNKMMTFATLVKQSYTSQRFEKLDNINFSDV